ncbi:MAG: DUF1330 domain-containing protein [Burkholderiales bacterium]|nr:DUF1330 domain-containing protein [Burkholderiales bacterium]
MSHAYVVGHIAVKDEARWAEYRSRVPQTLAPWGAELVFRGTRVAALGGAQPHPDIVVIRFASAADADAWFASPAYQALIPLRLQAADVVLSCYEA